MRRHRGHARIRAASASSLRHAVAYLNHHHPCPFATEVVGRDADLLEDLPGLQAKSRRRGIAFEQDDPPAAPEAPHFGFFRLRA